MQNWLIINRAYICDCNELVTRLGAAILVVLLPRICRGPLKPITRKNVLCLPHKGFSSQYRDQVVKIGFNQATCVQCAKLYLKSRDEIIPCAMLYFNALCKRTFNVNKKVIFCCWHKRARVSHARTARSVENVGIRQVFSS